MKQIFILFLVGVTTIFCSCGERGFFWDDNKDGFELADFWNGIDKLEKVNITTEVGNYSGYIENGKPSREGVLKYNNGMVYTGEWKSGLWDGRGTLTRGDTVITGQWKHGKLNGCAKYITANYIYVGGFADDVPFGEGYIKPLCGVDSGRVRHLKNGKYFGKNSIKFENGDTYEGDFKENEFDGKGTYKFTNGEEYVGEWKDGLQDGLGTYVSDLFSYEGHWEEGWMNGHGRITYENGDCYDGNLVENARYGLGTYYSNTGNVYEGEFIDDKFNGLGTYYFSDGSVYQGEFEDGRIKGDGTMYCVVDGDTVAITACWDGTNTFPKEVSILFSNEIIYEGPIVNGQPTSDGVWISVKTGKIRKMLDDANDWYKEHRETIQKVVLWTGLALSAVAITVSTLGAGAPAAIAMIGSTAGTLSVVIGGVDAAANVGSLVLDGNFEEARKETLKNVATDVVIAVLPAAGKGVCGLVKKLKSNAARKEGVKLSETATNFVKSKTKKSTARALKNGERTVTKSVVKISKTKPLKKVVSVEKKNGTLQKRLADGKKKFFEKVEKSKFNKKIEARNAKKAKKAAKKAAEKDKKLLEKAKRNPKGNPLGSMKSGNKELEQLYNALESKLGKEFAEGVLVQQTKRGTVLVSKDFPNTSMILRGDKCIAHSGSLKNSGPVNEFLNHPLPNKEYIVDDGIYKYVTDEYGRVVKATGDISRSTKTLKRNKTRNSDVQKSIIKDKNGRPGTDDGGHLFPNNTGGPNEAINQVPMDRNFNRHGEWRDHEREMEKAIREGKDVESEVRPIYSGSSKRPIAFELITKINGETTSKVIKNI